jgi:hypothetical protein
MPTRTSNFDRSRIVLFSVYTISRGENARLFRQRPGEAIFVCGSIALKAGSFRSPGLDIPVADEAYLGWRDHRNFPKFAG